MAYEGREKAERRPFLPDRAAKTTWMRFFLSTENEYFRSFWSIKYENFVNFTTKMKILLNKLTISYTKINFFVHLLV